MLEEFCVFTLGAVHIEFTWNSLARTVLFMPVVNTDTESFIDESGDWFMYAAILQPHYKCGDRPLLSE